MAGPSRATKRFVSETLNLRKRTERLSLLIKHWLRDDTKEDLAKRNKEFVRDVIKELMKALRIKQWMISESEGARLDQYPLLSSKEEKALEQEMHIHKYLKGRAKRTGRTYPAKVVIREINIVRKLNPELIDFLKENDKLAYERVMKIVGMERLCPIRKQKTSKGEINVQDSCGR